LSTGISAGNPAPSGVGRSRSVSWRRVRRSDLAVECHSGFKRHEWSSGSDVLGESFVHFAGFTLEKAAVDFDALSPQALESFAGDHWIGIGHRGIHPANAGADHGVGAGAGTPGV